MIERNKPVAAKNWKSNNPNEIEKTNELTSLNKEELH